MTGRIKYAPLTSFSITQNIEAFLMQMMMTTIAAVASSSASKRIAAVTVTGQQTKALKTAINAPPLRAIGLRFGQRQ